MALVKAFYAETTDQQRMAALLNRAADLILNDMGGPMPVPLGHVRWAEQQNIARRLKAMARDVLTVRW